MENTDNIEKIDLDRVDWKSSREFFESLGEALEKLDDKDESYNFTWVGKRKSIIEAGAPINKTLRPDINASKDFDNTKNMLIVGDNLDALKLLQESYLGKVKIVYIDPPYNTGHDFVYHDNFVTKKSDYNDLTKDLTGDIVVSEDKYIENSKANGRFHSDWLSMMYPRIKLARNLLCEDGMLISSIDEHEINNLLSVFYEIFGEDSYDILVWRKNGKQGNTKRITRFKISHEYLVVAYKNKSETTLGKMKLMPNWKNEYPNPDNDPRGPYKAGNISLNEEKSNPNKSTYYTITTPSGKEYTREWFISKEEFMKLDSDKVTTSDGRIVGRIYYPNNGDGVPALKIFKNEEQEYYFDSIVDEMGTFTEAHDSLKDLFDGVDIFETPKPVKMIKELIRINSNENDYVLDFFAGSGTTGHAVMELNAEDGKKRNYILAQLEEKTDDKSEAYKAGYKSVDKITIERLCRAGDKIKKEHPEAVIDTGFRVFHIDNSNENTDIHKPLGEIEQSGLFDAIDNIKKDRTSLDLLFGVVYVSALPFDLKLETRKIGENTVYLYGYLDEGTGLVACFDDNISEDTIKEIAKMKSLTAAFKDSSFADSAAKINLSEQFRVISPDTKVKVI